MRAAPVWSGSGAGRSLAALITTGLLVAAAIGCGGSGSLDSTRIEKAIEVSVAQQRHVLSIAVCPSGVARQAGKQFTCTVTIGNGQQSRFLVTEKDDKGNVRYQAAGAQH
jgi:Domain of unknown function (DUF4333)